MTLASRTTDERQQDPATGSIIFGIGLSKAERELCEVEVKAKMVDRIQLQDARQEGRQGGFIDILSLQIETRLGSLPQEILHKLRNMTDKELTGVGLAILSLESYSEVEDWISNNTTADQ